MPDTAAVAVPECSEDCSIFAMEQKNDGEGLVPPKAHFDFSLIYQTVSMRGRGMK